MNIGPGVAHLQSRGFAAYLGEVMALLDDVMLSDADNPLVALAGDIKALVVFWENFADWRDN